MIPIHFSYTHHIVTTLEAIISTVTMAEDLPSIPPNWTGRLRENILISTVYGSTAMEGSQLTKAQIARVIRGLKSAGRERDIRESQNYAEAMSYLNRVYMTNQPVNEEMILYFHHLICKNIPEFQPGRYRTGPGYIRDLGTDQRIFLPLDGPSVPGLMREYVEFINLPDHVLPFPIRAALAHLILVAIHPFVDGNGRTARVLSTLILYRGAPSLAGLLTLEEQFFDDRVNYYAAIAYAFGPVFNPQTDVTPWIEYYLTILGNTLTTAVRLFAQTAKITVKIFELTENYTTLSARQLVALFIAVFVWRHRLPFTRSYYQQAVKISSRTAGADISRLVNSGLLEARGKGPSVQYLPSQSLINHMSEELAWEPVTIQEGLQSLRGLRSGGVGTN